MACASGCTAGPVLFKHLLSYSGGNLCVCVTCTLAIGLQGSLLAHVRVAPAQVVGIDSGVVMLRLQVRRVSQISSMKDLGIMLRCAALHAELEWRGPN